MGWDNLAAKIPDFQRNPKLLARVQSYQEAKRSGGLAEWEKARGLAMTQVASRLDEEVEKYKTALRVKKPSLDVDFVRFEGSAPKSNEGKAYLLERGASPLDVVTKGTLGARLSAQERLGLEMAGITSLKELAQATDGELARATGHRTETVQKWGLQAQAQALQALLEAKP